MTEKSHWQIQQQNQADFGSMFKTEPIRYRMDWSLLVIISLAMTAGAVWGIWVAGGFQ